MKYFKIILDGNDKVGGILYAPIGINSGYISDSKKIPENVENLIFTLKNGSYTSYMGSNIGANLVNEDLKNLIEEFITNDYPIKFIPVTVCSDQHGNKQYFILYFDIIFDVINTSKTIYVDGTSQIIKVCLDEYKVNGLNIFNSQPVINDVIVSDCLRKKIKKQKMDLGIEFSQLNCV